MAASGSFLFRLRRTNPPVIGETDYKPPSSFRSDGLYPPHVIHFITFQISMIYIKSDLYKYILLLNMLVLSL